MSFHQKVIVIFFILLGATAAVWMGWFKRTPPPAPMIIPEREEVTVTIIPGWDLRDVADYLVKLGFASSSETVYKITGEPAKGENSEGFLIPQTYRVFKDSKLEDVIEKIIEQRNKEWAGIDFGEKEKETIIMASLLEKEARTPEDRRLVSDILRRRLDKNWALQLDSTVHYAFGISGTVFTTDKQRATKSPFNTYLNPGLPPSPICNPSVDSILAALNPEPNIYWYFLSGNDGRMHYARTLEEHNLNRVRYLR